MAEMLVGRSVQVRDLQAHFGAGSGPVLVYGEAGVGKTALVRAALSGQGVREGGCLATLSWSPYLPFRRAFGADLPPSTWTGDAEYAADAVATGLGDDLLFLDDVQWADPGSLRVIELLAGRIPMAIAVRRGDPASAAVLERLGAIATERIDLDPLPGDDATELVRRLQPRMPSHDVAAVVARSGGNPLLIEELADADGDVESLHLAVLARCRALPEEQLEGLAMLTVAGRPLPVADVPGAAGLVESGLVVDDGTRAAIRHALIGEVIGELVSDDRRQRCHTRLAAVLTHPGEVARHLLAAGDRDAAYVAAMRAVDEAATPGERIPHLETAARCVDPETGAEFRLRAAETANEVDECDIAAALLEEIPDRPDLRFRVARQHAITAYFRGDAEAHRAAIEDEARLARPGTEEEVLALAERSFLTLVVDGAFAEAVELAELASALAERVDAGHVAALKAVADAYYLASDPRWPEAYAAALERARLDGDFAREWRIANNFISARETFGPQAGAMQLALEMAGRCRDARLLGLQRNFEFRKLNLAGHACDYDTVLAEAPALATTASGMAVQFANDLLFTLASAQVDVGLVDEGLATAELILSRDNERGRSNYHMVRSWAFLEVGRPGQVLVEEAAFRACEIDTARLALTMPVFAWAAYETGAPHPELADDVPTYGMLAGADIEIRAIGALRAQEHTAAADGFRQAATAYEGFHRRAAARCRWAQGEALRLAGDPAASDVLTEAEEYARGYRLVGVVTRCERSLRALGVRRSAGVSRSTDSPLTDRERELVLLAADGLTDRAIAARLGLAHRTVQTQLANARRKLGAENRSHLISLVTGAGA